MVYEQHGGRHTFLGDGPKQIVRVCRIVRIVDTQLLLAISGEGTRQ